MTLMVCNDSVKVPQVEVAMVGDEAAAKLELRSDREGDIVVIAKKNAVTGS